MTTGQARSCARATMPCTAARGPSSPGRSPMRCARPRLPPAPPSMTAQCAALRSTPRVPTAPLETHPGSGSSNVAHTFTFPFARSTRRQETGVRSRNVCSRCRACFDPNRMFSSTRCPRPSARGSVRRSAAPRSCATSFPARLPGSPGKNTIEARFSRHARTRRSRRSPRPPKHTRGMPRSRSFSMRARRVSAFRLATALRFLRPGRLASRSHRASRTPRRRRTRRRSSARPARQPSAAAFVSARHPFQIRPCRPRRAIASRLISAAPRRRT